MPKTFIAAIAKTKMSQLPKPMIEELTNTINPNKIFNKWAYIFWVPYSARDNILDEIIETL